MANILDQINSNNQLILNDISDTLELIDSNISPIASYLYRNNQREGTTSTVFEWVENYTRKLRTVLVTALAATGTTATLDIKDKSAVVVNTMVCIGNEVMKVTDITGGVITVSRAYADTTLAAHVAGANVEILGIDIEEGGEFLKSSTLGAETITNRVGITYEEFEITDTAMATYITGQNGASAYEVESMKKKIELMTIIENRLINSKGYVSGKNRATKGIKHLVGENGLVHNGMSAAFDRNMLDVCIEKILDSGGKTELQQNKFALVVPYAQKIKIDKWDDSLIRKGITETVTGATITQVVSSVGILNVFYANSLKNDELLMVNLDNLTIKELYPIREVIAGKNKMANTFALYGEWGLQFRGLPYQMWIQDIAV